MTRLKASPRRIKPGSKRRATRITFRLTAPARVFFFVRGPAPSCELVGRFSVRGHRGTNRVRFAGRVGRKTLRPGTYAVTARPVGQPRARHRVVLIVGEGPRERLDCSTPTPLTFLGAAAFSGGSATEVSSGATAGRRAAPPRAEKSERRSRGVLPAIREKVRELPRALPRPSMPGEANSPPAILGLAALALLGLSALAILIYVIRFLRGPHTKSA